MYKTKTLIIGASFLGVGYAAANQDCIIIEKGENPVPDFVGCASLNKINADKAYSPSGKALLSELNQRKLLDENGNVHIYPVSGIMSDFILSKKLRVIMDTRPVSINKISGGYVVNIFSLNGFDEIHTESIIDTRPIIKNTNADVEYKKYINASVLGGGKEFENIVGVEIKHGLYGQSVLSMQVCKDASYTETRLELHEFISKNIKESKIASFASEFEYRFTDSICKKISDNYYWVPSASYNDFISAFESGAALSIF